MKENKAADFFIGIGIVIFGALVFAMSRDLPTAQFGLGSSGYPMFVSVLMMILGAVLAISAIAKGKIKLQFSAPADKTPILKTAFATAATFLYVFLLPHIGFLLLTPVFLFGLMLLFGYRKYVLAAVVSILLSTGVFYLFSRVFFIFLPTGLL